MIKTHYKTNLDKNLGHNKKNILSWSREIKNNELPITEIGWKFIFHLIKHKIKNRKIYFCSMQSKSNIHIDFFYLNKK